MIGQMQGKFQLEVLQGVGHMVHEVHVPDRLLHAQRVIHSFAQDDPSRLAELLVGFWKRNERVLVGIKKVGDS